MIPQMVYILTHIIYIYILTKPLSSSSLLKSDRTTALPNIAGKRMPPRAVSSCEPLTCNKVRATASTKSHSSADRFVREGLGGPQLISPLRFAPSIYNTCITIMLYYTVLWYR